MCRRVLQEEGCSPSGTGKKGPPPPPPPTPDQGEDTELPDQKQTQQAISRVHRYDYPQVSIQTDL